MKKRVITLLVAAAMTISLAACGNNVSENKSTNGNQDTSVTTESQSSKKTEEKTGKTLTDWSQENGWTAFYTFAQSDTYDDAWEAGAKAFGPQMGKDDLDGTALKALNIQMCGFDDEITHLDISDSMITALDTSDKEVFSYKYSYVTVVENAVEGAASYVYKTDDANAGNYTYICMTLPSVATDEGGVITSVSVRYGADGYESLFKDDYAGKTCVIIPAGTSEKDVDYTIRKVYGAETE